MKRTITKTVRPGTDYTPILGGPATVSLTISSESAGRASTYVGAKQVADDALPCTLENLILPSGMGLSIQATVSAVAVCEVRA